MGLFSDIARAAASAAISAAKEKAAEAISSKVEGLVEGGAAQLVLSGDCERRVYVYHGKPLKGIRPGKSFDAEVVTKPTKLVSDLNGDVWDTTNDGVALAYKGKPFGATSTIAKTLKELAANGRDVRVRCKMTGWYAPGIPEIVLTIPEPDEIFAWVDACKGLGKEISFEERHSEECESAASMLRERDRLARMCGVELPTGVEGFALYVEDSEWAGKRTRCRKRVETSTELMEVPASSSAKPHISVFVDGVKVAELSARNSNYRDALAHVGERPYLSCCERISRLDDSLVWRVVVVYGGRA